MSLYERIDELAARGEPAALLSIVRKDGSAPREVGDKMVVTRDDEYGTIGGGTVEHLAIQDAREVLRDDATSGVRTYELERGGNTGMVCGGEMDVFIDRVRGQARLYVAGGGHIGVELAHLAERMGYSVTVVDDREEYADEAEFPAEVDVRHGSYGDVLGDLPMGGETAVAVATRSGTFDQEAVAAALDGGAGYVGLVASDTKAQHVLDSLAEEGYLRRTLSRVRAPVGLDLGGSGPESVALSILAEVNMDQHAASGERATRLDLENLVVVRGGGDLGSGVVYRLRQAGYPVVITEVPDPTVVRRDVSFGAAVYEETVAVEDVQGRSADDLDHALELLAAGDVPVIEDPDATVAETLDPLAVVDAILAKGRFDTGTRRDDADVVVGIGPGFAAGEDVDAVVESDRGHQLGRVFYQGSASPYDGEPGERDGYTTERVVRAPSDGTWTSAVDIGDLVTAGDVVGHVGEAPVESAIDGLVRGVIHDGLDVEAGTKLGDVDPRGDAVDPSKISDKALCIGGGVLEAVLRLS